MSAPGQSRGTVKRITPAANNRFIDSEGLRYAASITRISQSDHVHVRPYIRNVFNHFRSGC
ncbi:MAG: hypothetical protein ACF8CQ_21590, partial [Rhodopirellula sp. JB044]|uniref:hypothetical protein n=1 Tax=Rhodopirellula sp. JB044 TaxID=3342844 RepID=UPI00370A77A4